MAEVPTFPEGEEVVFTPEDYAESVAAGPAREAPKEPVIPKEETAETEPKSWLENKRIALIIGIVGFIIIAIIFGFLFSTLDWELILSGGNVTTP